VGFWNPLDGGRQGGQRLRPAFALEQCFCRDRQWTVASAKRPSDAYDPYDEWKRKIRPTFTWPCSAWLDTGSVPQNP